MPTFSVLPPERIERLTKRARPTNRIDLSEFSAAIRQAVAISDGWGEVVLEPADNRRAIQRRLTIAGKALGYKIALKKPASTDTSLVYQAVSVEQIVRRLGQKAA